MKTVKYTVDLFEGSHLYEINLRDEDKDRFAIIGGAVVDSAVFGKIMEDLSEAETLKVDDIPIACWGILKYSDTMGEAWIFCDKIVEFHGSAVLRYGKQFLDKKRAYKRIQAAVDSSWDVANRYVQYMGFDYECTMRKWGPNGTDYNLYARVF